MNQDYDPSEYMKKLRRHKVYRDGRLQLWASLCNVAPWLPYAVIGLVLGVITFYVFNG